VVKKEKEPQSIFYLKRMEESDLPSVREIERLSFSNPWSELTFLGEIQNRSISFPYVIVHRLEKKVIGYIIFWMIKDQVQINNIAVHPHYRRRGIAEAVMTQVINQVERYGAKSITLEVRPSNFAALNLYTKLGFQVIGIRKGYYSNPPEDAIVMCRLKSNI